MATANELFSARNDAGFRVVGFVSTLVDRVRKARAYYATYNELQALSDAQLDDLGLKRSSISRIAQQAAYDY